MTITNYILNGPPRKQYRDEESYKQDAELSIFRLLSYIESNDLPLTKVAREHLEEIKRRNPDLRLPKDADLAAAEVEVEWGRSEFTIEEILKKQPKEVARLLKEYEGHWERSRRDLCEIVGKACRRNSNWCLQLLGEIKESVTELPDDSLNPIMWGLRSKERGEEETWKIEHVKKLFVLLEKMIDERPEAKFLDGLASLVESWEKDLDLGLDLWGNLTRRLSVIFATFDYERAEEDGPIEWIQRAINHPFGTLTELYLECANKAISSQAKSGEKYDLDAEILRFFEYTTQNYAAGTRYALCLLARHLGWLEAVVPNWTEKNLVPLFYRDNNRELTIVLWSGYLWGRTLSRYLSERFRDSYLHAATYYRDFAKQEQEGFVVHVAGLAWFGNIQLLS